MLTNRASLYVADDWTKLGRVLKCLPGVIDSCMSLEVDDYRKTKKWVGVSCGAHSDLKRHSGSAMNKTWAYQCALCTIVTKVIITLLLL